MGREIILYRFTSLSLYLFLSVLLFFSHYSTHTHTHAQMSVSLHLITTRLFFHFHHAIISLARSLSAICSVALSCFSISSSDLRAVSRAKHPKGLRHSVGWEDSQHSPRHVPGPISLDRGSLHSVRAAALYVVLSEGCVCVCVICTLVSWVSVRIDRYSRYKDW